jgi:hypothetical protein
LLSAQLKAHLDAARPQDAPTPQSPTGMRFQVANRPLSCLYKIWGMPGYKYLDVFFKNIKLAFSIQKYRELVFL